MSYFRSASGDFVNDQGQAITDPATRLQIGQSIGGDLNKLPLYNPQTASTPAPTPTPGSSTPAPTPTPTGSPTPGNSPTPTSAPNPTDPNAQPQTPSFSEFLKDPSSQTVYGYSNGKLTAFSNWNDLLSVNGGKAPKITTVQGLATNDSTKNASIYSPTSTPAKSTSDTGSLTSTGTPGAGDLNPDVTKTDTPTIDNNPVKTYTDQYNDVLTNLGIPTLKTTIDDTSKKYADLQDEKNGLIQDVNDNPWLSETDRARGINSINNKYQAKEALLTAQLTLYNNMYTQGINQANTIMGDVVQEQQTTQANAQKALEANTKIVQDYGVSTPYYTIDGQTIIRSSDGKVYSSYDQWVADGGGQGVPVQMIGGQMTQKDQATFQIQLQNADTARINALKKTNSSSPTVSTVGGNGILVGGIKVDPTIANDVQAVLEGRNTLASIKTNVGKSTAGQAYMKSLRDAITSIDPSFDFIASDAGGKFVSSTFYQKAVSAITSVLPNIDEAIKLSDTVKRIGFAPADKLLQSGEILFGNTKVANFHEAQKLIADEIGLALGQGSVSDMKLQLGFDITDPNLSADVFSSNLGIVKQFIQNRLDALNNQRYSSPTTSSTNTSSTSNSNETWSTPGVAQELTTLARNKGYTDQDMANLQTQGYTPAQVRELLK